MSNQKLDPVIEKHLFLTEFRKIGEGFWDGLKYSVSLTDVRDTLFNEAAALGDELGYGDLYPGITSVQDFLTELEIVLHRLRGASRDVRTFLFGFTARGMDGNEAVVRRAKMSFLSDSYRSMYAVQIVKERDEYSREMAGIHLGLVPLGSERAFFSGCVALAQTGNRIKERMTEADAEEAAKEVLEIFRNCRSDAELSVACQVLEAVTQASIGDLMR